MVIVRTWTNAQSTMAAVRQVYNATISSEARNAVLVLLVRSMANHIQCERRHCIENSSFLYAKKRINTFFHKHSQAHRATALCARRLTFALNKRCVIQALDVFLQAAPAWLRTGTFSVFTSNDLDEPLLRCICPEGMYGTGVGANGCTFGEALSCLENPCDGGDCQVRLIERSITL